MKSISLSVVMEPINKEMAWIRLLWPFNLSDVFSIIFGIISIGNGDETSDCIFGWCFGEFLSIICGGNLKSTLLLSFWGEVVETICSLFLVIGLESFGDDWTWFCNLFGVDFEMFIMDDVVFTNFFVDKSCGCCLFTTVLFGVVNIFAEVGLLLIKCFSLISFILLFTSCLFSFVIPIKIIIKLNSIRLF